MLENVAIKEGEEHILVFTWNTSAGEKIIEIDFSKYVDSYNADGKTLEMVIIDGTKTFGVKDNVFEKVGTAAALIDNIEIASEEQILDLFNTTDETLN
jgi:tRNA threonylcarbamoyladenosine modification (KEOPS) complex Cgi121 subunit